MAPKGEDGSWLRNDTDEWKSLDSISVRIFGMEAGDGSKRQQVVGVGASESDGEDDGYDGCFPWGRGNMSRKVYSDSTNVKSAAFARLDAHQDPEGVKTRAIYCCYGQLDHTREVQAVDSKSSGGSKQDSAASIKWEDVDLSDGHCKPSPYWRQLAWRARAHIHVRQAHSSRGNWLNYNPYSYQMNFDDGCQRDDCVSSLYIDGNHDSASRERAMQSALLKKFAASRAERVA